MTNLSRIVDFIHRFPGRDDDEIAAALSIKPRQSVNQVCRALVKAGTLKRQVGPTGKLANYPTQSGRLALGSTSGMTRAQLPETSRSVDATAEWFWEGNVTETVAAFLVTGGWSILSQADTRTKERGVDLHVKRADREMVIEVKGYPSTSYRDPSRAGQRKPTSPTLQAQHWYSHALLKALRLQTAYPSAVAALAFPDFPRYRSLFNETRTAFERLGIAFLFIDEAGGVDAHGV